MENLTLIFYCLANHLATIKLSDYSGGLTFFEEFKNLPSMSKLPLSEARIKAAFEEATELVLVNRLEDAIALRSVRVNLSEADSSDTNIGFYDFAIYEIEVSEEMHLEFQPLRKLPMEMLEKLLHGELYMRIYMGEQSSQNKRELIPDISIHQMATSELNPVLKNCYYYSSTEVNSELLNTNDLNKISSSANKRAEKH